MLTLTDHWFEVVDEVELALLRPLAESLELDILDGPVENDDLVEDMDGCAQLVIGVVCEPQKTPPTLSHDVSAAPRNDVSRTKSSHSGCSSNICSQSSALLNPALTANRKLSSGA